MNNKKPIKGYIARQPEPEKLDFGYGVASIGILINDLQNTKKDVIQASDAKLSEIDDKLEQVDKSLEEGQQKVQQATETLKDTTQAILDHVASITQGPAGIDADEERVVNTVLDRIPKLDEKKLASSILSQVPKINETSLLKKFIQQIPKNKADLKIVQETFETDPMSVITKILEMGDAFKLKTSHIEGLDQTIRAFQSQVSQRGYLHGGGDTVVAGTNITIVTNASGQKVISSTGGGGTPGGLNTQLQYNNNGVFGGISGATTNGTIVSLTNPLIGGATLTTSSVNGITLVSGGTSTLYLSQDGTYTTPPGIGTVTGTGVSGQVSYWTGTSSQAGNNNLFWDITNSRLGIGTVAPIASLHILETSGAASLGTVKGLVITQQSGGNDSIGFQNAGSSNKAWSFYQTGNNFSLYEYAAGQSFEGSGADRIFVQAGGNIGIGTTTPGSYKLNVQDPGAGGAGTGILNLQLTGASNAQALQITQANAGGSGNASQALFKISNAGSNPYFNFDDKFIMLAGGNIGIGTASPNAKLESLATTEQLRLSYDATHFSSFTVNSTGDLQFSAASGAINASGTFSVGSSIQAPFISNSSSSNNSKISFNTTGTVVSRNIADTNTALVVNQSNSGSTGLIQQWQFNSSGVAGVTVSGVFAGAGMSNSATSSNALVNTSTTGTVISRNVADANTGLIVTLINASATGKIFDAQFNGSSIFAIGKAGGIFLSTSAGTSGYVLTSQGAGAAAIWSPASGGSGITRSVNVVSTPTTAGATAATDYVYLVSGTTTITLPTAVGNTNLYTVTRTGTNTVTVATTGGQMINGAATATLLTQYETVSFISDNSNWYEA